jgi:hypothetical protein
MKPIRILVILLLSICSVSIYAHDRSESFSEWTWHENQVSYTFSILQREATRIPTQQRSEFGLDYLLSTYLAEQINVSVGNRACSVERVATVLKSREGFLHVEGSFRCANNAAPTITVNSFFDLAATHTHYARVRHKGQVEEFLLTQDRRSQTFAAPGNSEQRSLGGWQVFTQYLATGSKHILAGADHLAFLFGLILLASGWREMAWLITGFTLGHSISLALAVLGVAVPNGVMVEALIGFTIALVAIEAAGERSGQLSRISTWLFILCLLLLLPVWWENLKWKLVVGTLGAGIFSLCYLRIVSQASKRGAYRLLVTTTFGLIHGFGFAGGLLEMNFPAAEIAFVLLGFNLGVELGQLAVLAAVVILILAVDRFVSPLWQQRGTNATVTVLSGLGIFWFVSRLLV